MQESVKEFCVFHLILISLLFSHICRNKQKKVKFGRAEAPIVYIDMSNMRSTVGLVQSASLLSVSALFHENATSDTSCGD